MDEALEKPAGMLDDHLEYLDELRESGATNMFGATAYLMVEFGMDRKVAAPILGYWMKTFADRHTQGGAA